MENQIELRKGYGICPVCNGSCRRPTGNDKWKTVYAGYDPVTDTLPCTNCGGQYMFGRPSGQVRLRQDGTPCTHSYKSATIGRCLTRYTCAHCNEYYDIDSGD